MENMNRKIGYIIVVTFWLIVLSLISSCALTYEHPKCYLMLQGKSCLSDHSCCNPQTYNPQNYNHTNCLNCNHNILNNPNWYWWSWNKPTYTNYVIVKPNKPNNNPNNRPSFNNNSDNNGSTRPNQTNTTRKPRK